MTQESTQTSSSADQIAHLAILHPSKTDAAHNATLFAQFRIGRIRRIWLSFHGYKDKRPDTYISKLKAILKVKSAIYSVKLSSPTRIVISVSWPEPTTGLQEERVA
jgi:hypothetical protein